MGAKPLVLAAILAAASPTAFASAAHAPSWSEGTSAGRTFADITRLAPTSHLSDDVTSFAVQPPISFRGALYDHVILGPVPGTARLVWGEPDPFDDTRGLLLAPLGTRLKAAPDARVQVRRDGNAIALRWLMLVDDSGQRATFDALIEPDDIGRADVTYQFLVVPQRSRGDVAGMRLEDRSAPDALSLPVAEGLRLSGGTIVVFPGDVPWNPILEPFTGCGIGTPWCVAVTTPDPGCYTGTGFAGLTLCDVTVSKRWHFNESMYCRSCPYTYYVTVECGKEMHLPTRDMEGNQVAITDVFTGVQLEMEAMNDCFLSPFDYCDCTGFNAATTPDPTGTMCPGSHVPCIPYYQRSTLIQWGWPLFDRDGDTDADDLPCGPPNGDACLGASTYGSGAYLGSQEQNIDVILHGDPALCGVFRLDIVSGGFHWYLTANCTGTVTTSNNPADWVDNFNLYQDCSAALAAFDPVPELAITKLDVTGICPDISLEIEVTNLGCSDTQSAPVRLHFAGGEPDMDIDLGVVPAGTATSLEIPVTLLGSAIQTITASVDPDGVIDECSEQAPNSFSGCEPTAGSRTQAIIACACSNSVVAETTSSNLLTCNGNPVTLDAGPSTALPCLGGRAEYQFLDSTGGVLQDWGPASTATVVPATCPSMESYTINVRCSSEIQPACIDTVDVEVECRLGTDVTAANSATPICQGEAVTISAPPGFVSYRWSNGWTGPSFEDRPASDTTYTVTAVDANGCTSTASTSVEVLPDPIPGPLGGYLRVRKEWPDVVFNFRQLPTLVGSYDVVCHAMDGNSTPCPAFRPSDPTPTVMQDSPTVATGPMGTPPWTLRHLNGCLICPNLLFYKVVGTSPCTHVRGATCEPWPTQLLPCP